MKTIISLKALQDALKATSATAKKDAPKPILRCVKIVATDGTFEAIATTMEATVKSRGDVYQTIAAGEALLTQDAVKRILSTKGAQKVTVQYEGGILTLLFESSKATFTTEDVEDFPTCDDPREKAPIASLDDEQILKALARVEKCTEKENTRYALGSVLLDTKTAPGKASFVTTDGRRMAVQTYATTTGKAGFFILPKESFQACKKIFKGHGAVKICALGDTHITFQGEKAEYTFPLLEGRFPEWQRGLYQIARDPDLKRCKISAASLLVCDSFVKGVTDATNPGVVFERFSNDSLMLYGRLGTDEGAAISKGHALPEDFPTIKLNWPFLCDLAKATPDAVYDVQIVDGKKGVFFATDDGLEYLVMPMHLDISPEKVALVKADLQEREADEKAEEKAPAKKARKTAKKAHALDASTPAATTAAPEKQAEGPEPALEAAKSTIREAAEKLKGEAEAAKKAPWVASLAKLVTEARKEGKPLDLAPRKEPQPQPQPEPLPPAPIRPKRAIIEEEEATEKPFEVGTYTTKKGKVKAAVLFKVTPLPEWVEALKKAYFWEYNGTWNGSPRKLPEIFKH